MGNLRVFSRQEWGSVGTSPSVNEIAVGAFQRIADATEKMAGDYTAVIAERDRYKRWYEDSQNEQHRLARRIVALRGVITRIKRRKARR